MRRHWLLLPVVFGLLALPVAAQGRKPVATPATSPEPMTFRLVSSNPDAPRERQIRWVTASGAITNDTPRRFDAFLKDNPLDETLTIYFDSKGGSILGGLELGERLRTVRARVAIGRSTAVDNGDAEGAAGPARLPRHQLVPNLGLCFSSCAYAFLGGRHRFVPIGASYGVHMFWPSDKMEDLFGRRYGFEEIERAQRISARLGTYIQKMGVDLKLLELAASSPPRNSIRRLSPREIVELKVGSVVTGVPLFSGEGAWGLATADRTVSLSTGGLARRPGKPDLRYVLELSCHPDTGFLRARFEQSPVVAPTEAAPVTLSRAVLASGETSATLAASGKDIIALPARFPRLAATNAGHWIGKSGVIVDDPLRNLLARPADGLRVMLDEDENRRSEIVIPTASFASAGRAFLNACDGLRKGDKPVE